jgi:hypothetical protein
MSSQQSYNAFASIRQQNAKSGRAKKAAGKGLEKGRKGVEKALGRLPVVVVKTIKPYRPRI